MNKTIPRSDHYYRLWLLLVTISARSPDSFSPTPEETTEISDLATLAGLTDDGLAKMRSMACRFAQVQNELATFVGDEKAFSACVQETRDLTRELSTTTRKLKAQIQAAELRQHALAEALLRGGALRKESELIQRAMAMEGRR